MAARLPKWATADAYSIEARPGCSPTDFQVAADFETKLVPHADGLPCPDPADPAAPSVPASRNPPFPPFCDPGPAVLRKFGGALMQAGDAFRAGPVPPADRQNQESATFRHARPDTPVATSVQPVRDQMGLKVEAADTLGRRLIVDTVERPSEN